MNRAVVHLVLPIFLLGGCDDPDPRNKLTESGKNYRHGSRQEQTKNLNGSVSKQKVKDRLTSIRKIDDTDARNKALSDLAWETMGDDPNVSIAAFQEISADSQEKLPLIESMAMQLAQKDPEAALAWAKSLGSEKEIEVAKGQVIEILAAQDPPRAARLLPKPSSTDQEMDGTALLILHRWMALSPQDAASWVSKFPSGEYRQAAVRAVASDWSESDLGAFNSWLGSLSDSNLQNEATQAATEHFKMLAPENRAIWLEQANPSLRQALEIEESRIQEEAQLEGSPEGP